MLSLSLSLCIYDILYSYFISIFTHIQLVYFVWIFVHQPPEKRSLNQTWIPVKVQRISSSRHLSCCRINLGTTSKQVIQGPAALKGKDLKINMSYGYDCVFIIFYHKEYILKTSYTFGGRYHFSSSPILFLSNKIIALFPGGHFLSQKQRVLVICNVLPREIHGWISEAGLLVARAADGSGREAVQPPWAAELGKAIDGERTGKTQTCFLLEWPKSGVGKEQNHM